MAKEETAISANTKQHANLIIASLLPGGTMLEAGEGFGNFYFFMLFGHRTP